MANVLNRKTKEYLISVNTPDYSQEDWIINPNLNLVKDLPVSHWIIDGDEVRPPNEIEIISINESELSLQKEYFLSQVNLKTTTLLEAPIEITSNKFVDSFDIDRILQNIFIGINYQFLNFPQTISLVDGKIFSIENQEQLNQILETIITTRQNIFENANQLKLQIQNAISVEELLNIKDER